MSSTPQQTSTVLSESKFNIAIGSRFVLLLVWLLLAACRSDVAQQTAHQSSVDALPVGKLDTTLARPLYYRLHMQIDPRQPQFAAELELDIELLQADDGIWLHGQNLDIRQIALRDSEVEVDYQQRHASGVVRISFAQPQPAGPLTLLISYRGRFDDNLAGLFRVQEQGDWYALAKSESIQARKYLPGFDQPGFKAPFAITLDIPDGQQAISNTPVVGHSALDNGLTRWQFMPTPPMPTYLLSLAVGPFDVQEYPSIPANAIRDRDIPLRAVARRGKVDAMQQVMAISAEFIDILESELGVAYPFRKLDIIAAPAWPSGATELSAAISYREERLFLPTDAPPAARLGMLGIHAHELAHMWFGNLVTPPWWDDLWLKEGFATWVTYWLLQRFEPEQSHALNGLQRSFAVMADDALASARAIREPITRNEDIRNAYDGITYSKGQAVLHMLDSYFGADRFRAALGDYLREFSHDVAAAEDFYSSIAASMQQPELITTLRSFVEQSGVPVVQVNAACNDDGTLINLEQNRYMPLGSPLREQLATAGERRWSIPLCLRYAIAGNSHRHCELLAAKQRSITLPQAQCPDWIMPNAAGSGYYRWQLSASGWRQLGQHFEQLAAGEKLAVIDSLQAAVAAGDAKPEQLLALTENMLQTHATQPRQVMQAPLAVFRDYLQRVLPQAEAEALRARLKMLYRDVDVCSDTAGSTDQQLLCRRMQQFRAMSLRDSLLRAELADRAARFIGLYGEPAPAALDADLYELALSVAVADIGPRFFAALIEFAGDFDDPRFAAAVPVALGAFSDAELLPVAHEMLLQPANEDTAQAALLGPRERYDMIMSMLASPALRSQHWVWYQANLAQILTLIPAQWQRRTPNAAAMFCSAQQAQELQQLFARHGALAPGHERALAQTLESIQLCTALRRHFTTAADTLTAAQVAHD